MRVALLDEAVDVEGESSAWTLSFLRGGGRQVSSRVCHLRARLSRLLLFVLTLATSSSVIDWEVLEQRIAAVHDWVAACVSRYGELHTIFELDEIDADEEAGVLGGHVARPGAVRHDRTRAGDAFMQMLMLTTFLRENDVILSHLSLSLTLTLSPCDPGRCRRSCHVVDVCFGGSCGSHD